MLEVLVFWLLVLAGVPRERAAIGVFGPMFARPKTVVLRLSPKDGRVAIEFYSIKFKMDETVRRGGWEDTTCIAETPALKMECGRLICLIMERWPDTTIHDETSVSRGAVAARFIDIINSDRS